MKITYAVLQAFVEAFTEQYDLDYEVNKVLIRGVYPIRGTSTKYHKWGRKSTPYGEFCYNR